MDSQVFGDIKEGIFTEQLLRDFRQIDRQYTLSHKDDGSWNLKYVGNWQYDKVDIRPSSELPVVSLSGQSVKPCSIDWSWTHNPATYHEVILSDDMVHNLGEGEGEWMVTYPKYTPQIWATTSNHFSFVIRLPEEATCAVNGIQLSFNGCKLDLPVKLKPGDYVSIPHLASLVCVYNKRHELLEEKYIRGVLPCVKEGKSAKIKVSCTPEQKGEKPLLIMNVRCHHGHFYFE